MRIKLIIGVVVYSAFASGFHQISVRVEEKHATDFTTITAQSV